MVSVTGTSFERLVALVAEAGGHGEALLAGERGPSRTRPTGTARFAVLGDATETVLIVMSVGEAHLLGPAPADCAESR